MLYFYAYVMAAPGLTDDTNGANFRRAICIAAVPLTPALTRYEYIVGLCLTLSWPEKKIA